MYGKNHASRFCEHRTAICIVRGIIVVENTPSVQNDDFDTPSYTTLLTCPPTPLYSNYTSHIDQCHQLAHIQDDGSNRSTRIDKSRMLRKVPSTCDEVYQALLLVVDENRIGC